MLIKIKYHLIASKLSRPLKKCFISNQYLQIYIILKDLTTLKSPNNYSNFFEDTFF